MNSFRIRGWKSLVKDIRKNPTFAHKVLQASTTSVIDRALFCNNFTRPDGKDFMMS
jgi:hypothetical protein